MPIGLLSVDPYPTWPCTEISSLHYSPSIKNSSGKDSESAASPVSSIPTNNELDRCKSSCGSLSLDQALNEDPPMSASEVPLLPCFSGPSSPDKHSYYDSKPTSYIGSNAPSSRPGGDFESSQPFLVGLPVGPAQTNATSGDTTLVSFFCHACGLFIQGERSEALEILVQHRCTKPIDAGYADPSGYSPPSISHGRRAPSYAEPYPRPNPTRARPGLKTGLARKPRGHASSYYDGHPQSPLSFASFKQLMLDASRPRFQDTYLEHRHRFKLPGDADNISDPKFPADAAQNTIRHSYLNPNTYSDCQPMTLDWPREKDDSDDLAASNTVVNPQVVNATYCRISSAHPFQQYDERGISASQDGPRFGSTPALSPYEFVSGQPRDPDVVSTGTMDWPQTRNSDSPYSSRPNHPVRHGYPPYTAQFGPYDLV